MVYQWFGLKTTMTVFSVLASKLVVMVFFGLPSKSVATVSPDLASKPVARLSRVGPQNWQLQFDDLSLKTKRSTIWFHARVSICFAVPRFCSADIRFRTERAPVRLVWFWLSRPE
jgi:hypothetical protein